jgi:hypothetical protein
VALAQDLFMSDVDDGGENPSPPPRTGRARKPAEKEGRLARMVRELRAIEDHIVAKLAATQRHLTQLEARRVHTDAGYTSEAEFEERMLAASPFLRAMREANRQPANLVVAPGSHRRESTDERARKTKALTAVARTLERMRATDTELHDVSAKARAKLCAIEGMRTFEECGYSSFDEFLERALGPSPVLSSAVALIAAEPLVVSTESEDNQRVSDFAAQTLTAGEEPTSEEQPIESESSAFAPSVFSESETVDAPGMFGEPIDAFSSSSSDESDADHGSLGDAPANDANEDPARAAGNPTEKGAAPSKRKAGMIASVALCLVGIIGAWGAIASDRAHPAPSAEAKPAIAAEDKPSEAKPAEGKSKESKSAAKKAAAEAKNAAAPEAKNSAAAARAHAE